MDTDRMHPWVLRELADVVALPFFIIFEKSWRAGGVPDEWRKKNVTPIFKKGKKEDLGDYLLISLTSICGKVMKQIILEVITKHVEEKKVIRSSQYGFTKGNHAQPICLPPLMARQDGSMRGEQ
ncbi:rna-directed dna polymerase from mobile element jockey-like [Pitangus sulphuratus]|nr:rna-directed dna polymerase from mobile element jockey-like [Pitangus sulphuratus]